MQFTQHFSTLPHPHNGTSLRTRFSLDQHNADSDASPAAQGATCAGTNCSFETCPVLRRPPPSLQCRGAGGAAGVHKGTGATLPVRVPWRQPWHPVTDTFSSADSASDAHCPQITPVGDRVCVKVASAEEKTTGGILLPTEAQRKPTSGALSAPLASSAVLFPRDESATDPRAVL